MNNRKVYVDKLSFSQISAPQQTDYTYRWAGTSTDWHKHNDFYEISLITHGSYTHHHEKTVETIAEGDLLLFDAGETHFLTSPLSGNSAHFTVCLTKPYFRLLTQLFSINQNLFDKTKYYNVHLTETAYQFLVALSNALLREPKNEEKTVKLFFHNAIHFLLDGNTNSTAPHTDIVDDIIEKICNYTYLNLSTQEIYARYPYSIPTIIKKFKQKTGTTVSHYQTNIRLEYAARLLRETNNTIDSIVTNIGFLSTGHFFEIFKEHYGVSPNVYRKNSKESVAK